MSEPIHIISLGAGVQSSTMALMAAHGEITPMPTAAIFADTQAEPRRVYEWLGWLEKRLPFPVHRVTGGNLLSDSMAGTNSTGGRYSPVPWYGQNGLGRRQCTREYKLRPLQRKQREIAAHSFAWIGITTDEAARIKPSRVRYVTNRWPLVELGMSRNDCLRWMESHGYPRPPRSSCVFCPFKSDSEWADMRDTAPDDWSVAVAVDKAIRDQRRRTQFAHRSLVPLADVKLRAEDAGQLNMFNNECLGMCGL